MTLADTLTLPDRETTARMPLLSRLAFNAAFMIAKWQLRSATRNGLNRLDHHLLCDIGIEADVAQAECAKRFWQD